METVSTPRDFAKATYNISLDSIQMALALTVALAWYAFVKGCIGVVWKDRGDKIWILGAYAIIITIIFAAVIVFMKNVLKANVTQRPVIHALTQSTF